MTDKADKEFIAAVNVTKGYKTAFNSKLHNAAESIATFMAAPNQSSERFAERDFRKVDNYFDTLQNSYIRAINLANDAPENQEGKEKVELKFKEATESLDKLRDDLRQALAVGYKTLVVTGAVPKTVVKSTTVQRLSLIHI